MSGDGVIWGPKQVEFDVAADDSGASLQLAKLASSGLSLLESVRCGACARLALPQHPWSRCSCWLGDRVREAARYVAGWARAQGHWWPELYPLLAADVQAMW